MARMQAAMAKEQEIKELEEQEYEYLESLHATIQREQ